MKNFKKALALLVALSMIFSLCAMNVFAADAVAITAEPVTIAPGAEGIVSVSANQATAYGFGSQMTWSYDNTKFTVTLEGTSTFDTNITEDEILIGSMGAASSKDGEPIFQLKVKVAEGVAPGEYKFVNTYCDLYTSGLDAMEGATAGDIVINVGGSAPEPTATVAPEPTATPAAPTATPAAPTATPAATATPAPQSITVSFSDPKDGKDFKVTVIRADGTKEGTTTVVVKNGAGTEITATVTFAAGEIKASVTFTAEQMATLGTIGENITVGTTYTDEDNAAGITESKDGVIKKPSNGTSSNSGITVGADGTSSVPTATPGASTGDVTEPTEAPDATEAPVETSVFTDVPASHWAYSYIMDLYEAGIVNGVSATEFMPDSNVTRAEFTKMAVGIFGLTATTTTTQFVDVPATEWYASAVAAATEAGIVQGISDTEFGPNENITREQMATIIGRQYGMMNDTALTYTDAANVEAYAVPYVAALSEAGYLTGDNGMFYPKNNATRAEAATLLDRVYVATAVVEEPEATEAPATDVDADVEATEAPDADVDAEATATPDTDAEATAEPEATATADAE